MASQPQDGLHCLVGAALVEEAGESFLACLAELEAGRVPELAVQPERGY